MSFFEELKRRNVFRVGVAYAVAAWVLLQVADLVLENIEAPSWVIQALMLLVALGFVAAVVVAWAYELTPDGIKKESEVDRSRSIVTETGRKLDRIIIGFLTVAVAVLLLERFISPGPAPGPVEETSLSQSATPPDQSADATTEAVVNENSVAVLPFVNMSGDANNEYFSDGLTETLLHMLAQIPELKVAARTSSFAFKGQASSITEIAGTLGVAHILEGSVQKADNRVRVTAQLIRADDGFHIWSQNYDRTLEDIFAIQDEIANDVVNALDESLLGGSRRLASLNTHDLDAYESYLKALEQQAIFTYTSLGQAESLLKQALAQDPGFIDAKLSLARNYLMMSGTGLITPEESNLKLAPLVEQAREVQPDNPLARALTLLVELDYTIVRDENRNNELMDEMRALLALIPTDTYVRSIVANWLDFFYREHEAAIEVIDAGLLVDPLSAYLHARRAIVLRSMDRQAEAKLSILRSIELEPGYASAYHRMANIVAEEGKLAESLDWRRKAIKADPEDHELASFLAINLYMLGLPEEGDPWADRVQALAPESDVAKQTALFRAYAHGDLERAEEQARSMIRDQVSPRQNAIFDAVFVYQWLLGRDRRDSEGFDFLVEIRPELADYRNMPSDVQGIAMQWVGVIFMGAFKSQEETLAAWEQFVQNLEATGGRWHEDDEGFRMMNQYFRGNYEEAVRIALKEDLAKPLATWIGRNEGYRTPVFSHLAADPRVSARLDERDRELKQARREVQAMLRQPEWN